jgi:hypothetical protein
VLSRILIIAVKMVFFILISWNVIACSAEPNNSNQDSKTVRLESGSGKEELLKWFRSNMKYAAMFGFMKKREEQINQCVETKIVCEWFLGSAITNSGKGYIVTFKDNKFTVGEFPAGSETEYGITKKDIYFKKK